MNALHPDDRSMDDWSAALSPGEPFEKEARLRQFDGEYRRFLLRFVPLRDERGRIVEWYAESTDIEDLSVPGRSRVSARLTCAMRRWNLPTPIG